MSCTKNKIILAVTAVLLVICLFSVIGVTHARLFTTIFSGAVNVASLSNNSVYIYGNNITDDEVSKEWKNVSDGWKLGDGNADLKFFVANGTGEDEFASRNQTFRIMLIAGLGGENMIVTLSYMDGDGNKKEIVSTVNKIAEGTALYSSNGPGWVYRFCDENGEEIVFSLDGEKLSYKNFELSVEGTNELSLLNLQVVGEYAD